MTKKLTMSVRQGDCLKLLPQLAPGSVNLAFCDPPFNINYDYDKYKDNRKPEHYLEWCEQWLSQLSRVVAADGSLWLAIGDEFVSELDVLAKKVGFYKRSHVLWYYTFGVACPKNFARSHTHLLYYTQHKTKFTFNRDSKAVRVPSARQLIYKDTRANPNGKLPDNTWVLSPLDLDKAFTEAEDTWLCSRVCGTFGERQDRGTYGAARGCPQMPLAIMNRIILATSNPGDLVLDPMSGTFSTGAAAVQNRRSFVGFDISAAYCERGTARLRNVANEQRAPVKPVTGDRSKGSRGTSARRKG
jgi:site-specific DNA-methyltransferase (adenine-specific)